ncbi:MAG: hypothetical protein ABMA13_12875 [Chthoniobacteraceae bacterium]
MKLVALIIPLALAGCALPIPTTRVVAPGIHGRVIHANTGAPVDLAGVMVEGYKEASVVTARDGSFKTDQITRTQPFWVWWPFAGDPVREVKLRVARPGFDKHKEKVAWRPKSQPHVWLAQPIALQPKSAGESAAELIERAGR